MEVQVDVPTTSYLYNGTLDYATTYFWRVRAIEPTVSDPSAIGPFTVMAAPKPSSPQVEEPQTIPSWVWWIIAVLTALVGSIIAFVMVKPGYARPRGGGKLFNVEPVVEKEKKTKEIKEPKVPKEPKAPKIKAASNQAFILAMGKTKIAFTRFWQDIAASVKRWKIFKKRTDIKPDDSQDKLT